MGTQAEPARMLVFIGASVRALTESAVRAGLGAHNQLVAVDLFGDRETRAAADRWIQLNPDSSGVHGLCTFLRGEGSAANQDHLPKGRLPSGSAANPAVSFVVGGGVEPWWSDWAAQLQAFGRVFGPTPEAQDALADLPERMAPFADAVRCPPRATASVPDAGRWWVKALHRAGGLQVRAGAPLELIPPNCYAERHVAGDEFSLGFWVEEDHIEVVCAAESVAEPVPGGRGRMESQIVHADPRQIPTAAVALAAEGGSVLTETLPRHLARNLAHTGFLGFDLIRDTAGCCWLLDVNLRPTASMLCLPDFAAWLARWVGGSDGVLQVASDTFEVRATIFAPRDLDFDPACTDGLTDDPEVWLTDLPFGPQHFAEGAPVCTVRASGPERTRVLQAAEALCARVRSIL